MSSWKRTKTILATTAIIPLVGGGEALAESAEEHRRRAQAGRQIAQVQSPPTPDAQTLPPISITADRAQRPDQAYKVDAASSPKLTAPLLDTPQTISVIPQAVIREQGARNLTEVLRNTPGISFNAGENGFSTSTNNFSLRGFDSSGNIFIDGTRDSGSYGRDIFNIEQVEVVKGAAADNGRGGPGGYINMVTKTPKAENFISGGISYGFDEYDSEGRKRATLDVNRVIGTNTAVRLNLLREDSGIAGRETAEKSSWGFAPSVTFGLGTPFRATLAYEHVTQDDRPDYGVPGATLRGLRAYNPLVGSAPRDAFYGLSSDFDDTTSNSLLGRLEYDFNERVTLSNQTRWTQVDRQARFTVPTGVVAGPPAQATTQSQFYDRENTSLSNQTNLAIRFNTGALRHRVSTGIELTREESDANRFGTANPGNTSLFDPNPGRANGAPFVATERNDVRVDTIAAYAYDTVEINRQWEVTGGLRLERYKAQIGSRTAAGAPAGALADFEQSDTTLGGKIGATYKPVENGSIYTSFGVSALPPGSYLANPDISRTGDNAFPGFVQGAKSITSYNYEIGTKWNLLDDKLSLTAALFRTEKHDVAITGREGAETADSLKGYGKQIAQGIELGASGRITNAWSVFGGVLLMDSERKHSAYLDAVRRQASPGDYGAVLRTSGDQLAFTPQFSASLWTSYRFPIGLTVGGGLQHVGTSFLGRPDDANRIIPNDTFGKLPSYTLVHAMASYELTENVNLRLNIDNVFDEDYAVSSNWNGSRATLGTPRTYMMSMDFRF